MDNKITDDDDYMHGYVTNPRALGALAKLYGQPRVAPYTERTVEWNEWLDGYDGAEITHIDLGSVDEILAAGSSKQ